MDTVKPTIAVPESLVLPPGQLSLVNRAGKGLPADVFRCFGCVKPECQSASGCASYPWRYSPDGYLREVLTARVYDVAIQTPLETARKLSDAMGGGNTLLLKREDLQPVFSFKLRGAYNKMAKLPKDILAKGVITASAGNHAQGGGARCRQAGEGTHAKGELGADLDAAPPTRLSQGASGMHHRMRSCSHAQSAVLTRHPAATLWELPPGAVQQQHRLARGRPADTYGATDSVTVPPCPPPQGCTALICMPVSTPEIKVANVRKLGGVVELVGESFQETQAHAVKRSAAEGLVYVPPYDDPHTIAGQGTIGDEILRQISDPDSLDAIFVPVGGGGLIAGIAAFVKALKPSVQIIGVEPSGANAMALSLMAGERVTLSRVDAFADGVAVKQVGQETFRMCQTLVDGVVLVDNSAISAAIKDVFNETRSILEPAGALAVAGAKAWIKEHGHTGKTVVAVTSGANINFERLRLVAELANVGGLTEATMATAIPERAGAFSTLISTALGEEGGREHDLDHRAQVQVGLGSGDLYSVGGSAQVLWGAGISSPGQLTALLKRLHQADMPTVDISGMEVAQLHLRHLVGGRARAFTGQVPYERIFQVIFPEVAGALRRFLSVVSPTWNVTLFHYRNTGNRESSVLMGVQVPPQDEEQFAAAMLQLSSEFTFKELEGSVRNVFDMFIQ
ncbi:MAG: hypothetical protein WDW36_001969 [Sanguina aurantia]